MALTPEQARKLEEKEHRRANREYRFGAPLWALCAGLLVGYFAGGLMAAALLSR